MAQITLRTDDLNGSGEAQTVEFAVKGQKFTIDLNAENQAKFDKALEKFVQAATPVTGRSTGSARNSREDATAIREWAKENGHEVSDKGRLPLALIQAFDAQGK